MRPQKARNIINKSISYYLKGNRSALYKALPAIKKMYKKCKIEEKRLCSEYDIEPDIRSGNEIYGYFNQVSIDNNLMYISDRWNCVFRLRWLLDGVQNYLF